MMLIKLKWMTCKDAIQEVKTMNGENSKRKQPLNEDKISPAKKKAKDGEKKC